MGTIAVDFDGVIHTYERGWDDGTIYGDLMPGAMDALRGLMKKHAVFIHTTRDLIPVANWIQARTGISCAADGVDVHPGTFWNDQHVLLVANRKLAALAYIDDRGVRFESWSQVLAVLGEVLDA
jgi:hypothetical protein